MLQAVLSVANMEQSSILPPSVYSSQYNTVTSLLLSKLVSLYPSNPMVLDILAPFVERKVIKVKNGMVDLPENYRNILGSPMISATDDGCKECEDGNTDIQQFNQLILKSGCKKVALVIVPQSEFADRTKSSYDAPTFDKPIGYMAGKNQIKVCPYNINAVEVIYTIKEKLYIYGYDVQPDDTYTFNASKSVESDWGSNAFDYIFPAMISLYGAYSRDNQVIDWTQILNQQGIF